ncbi:uncharacterized protein LOC113464461 [Ceratina calcarata]|uniref:Uncharacterized protein LOC113464461 n=1 Tax=Ceratina calcarata TaxID=156304 RepID=A0AAJ7WBD6_9HYME|nr:uncharacterized protein LOC113464461 [Ceratina calcarata]
MSMERGMLMGEVPREKSISLHLRKARTLMDADILRVEFLGRNFKEEHDFRLTRCIAVNPANLDTIASGHGQETRALSSSLDSTSKVDYGMLPLKRTNRRKSDLEIQSDRETEACDVAMIHHVA